MGLAFIASLIAASARGRKRQPDSARRGADRRHDAIGPGLNERGDGEGNQGGKRRPISPPLPKIRQRQIVIRPDIAVQRDPFPPEWYWEARSTPLLQERRYEEMIQVYDHIAELQVWHLPYLAICYAHLGRIEEAKTQAAEILRLKPDFSMKWIIAMEPYKNPADLEHLLDGLRKAGLPE